MSDLHSSPTSDVDSLPSETFGAQAEVETPVVVESEIPAAVDAVVVDAAEAEAGDEAAVDEGEGESFSDIFAEFSKTSNRRTGEEGRQILGTVAAVTEDSVLVDIGFKTEGILPLTAMPAGREPWKVGDALTVQVKGRDEDGYYMLSLFRVAQPKDWSALQKAFADGANIVGTVVAIVGEKIFRIDCGTGVDGVGL